MNSVIEKLIKSGILKTETIIDAFRNISRTEFVPNTFRSVANQDISVPIGSGASIPKISAVVWAFEILEIKKGETVAVSGHTGGWITALMSYLVGKDGLTVSIGRVKDMQDKVFERIKRFDSLKYNKLESFNFRFDERSSCPMVARKGEFNKIILIEKCMKLDALKGLLKNGGKAVVIGDDLLTVIKKDDSGNVDVKAHKCECY